jgi:hypothetical protein
VVVRPEVPPLTVAHLSVESPAQQKLSRNTRAKVGRRRLSIHYKFHITLRIAWLAAAADPGKVRLLGYLESADTGSYRQTADHSELMEDITQTLDRHRYTYELGINVDKEIAKDIGAFLWVGYRDSNYEVWQFTEIDESVALGMQAKDSLKLSEGNGRAGIGKRR